MSATWRQGDLVSPDDAIALGLIHSTQRATHRAVLISHSCDVAADADTEPELELLVGQVIDSSDQSCCNGHSIRRLSLLANSIQSCERVLYCIEPRIRLSKSSLFGCDPWEDYSYSKSQRDLLRRWLAQRYARAEFPDAFIGWLTGCSRVGAKLDKLCKQYSQWLVGIYFDLDDDSERQDPNDPYELGITLVYASANIEASVKASEFKSKLEAAFELRCRASGQWEWIELLYCDVASDQAFSLQALNTFRRWRLEHRSLAGEPIDESE